MINDEIFHFGEGGSQARVIEKYLFKVIGFLLMMQLGGFSLFAQEVPENIPLKVEKLPLDPKHFYIAEVWDEREDHSSVARLWTNNSSKLLDVEKGSDKLKNYYLESLPKNPELIPVIVRIGKIRIDEESGGGRSVPGKVKLVISFYKKGEDSPVHLIDYRGGVQYKRTAGQYQLISTVLSRALENSLQFFVKWIDQEIDSNINLAKGVKVFFRDYDEVESGDTVFYTPSRPIKWEDFQAPTRPGKYVASIFTSFSWEGESKVVDGWVHLYLTTKVFMLKNSSWVKSGSRDAYGLNHERRHFDITKLVVERFKKNIKNREMTPSDFDGVIGYEYLQTYRKMNKLQEAYDRETNNGRDRAAQEEWNTYIKEELAKVQKANDLAQ
ncbi:hypothetical protein QWY93_10740 [Echinicola jeungdonensis]|uniref:Uncharacterized protein n=1 Tax=Echinicola jeungdonensis TaxID=709343 RepID=A0ABV5J886_9BACT|nr:hypothetical protein [Echinicola jeungdonensis]MDN3669800.1 hypothetical protein [Echinicola jeungdonensis]